MDPSYTDGMVALAGKFDGKRGVRIQVMRIREHPDRRVSPNWESIAIHALLLWREAGSPLPFIAHLGDFYRIEALN